MSKWRYEVEKGGASDYHVKAFCPKCGWQHFSNEYCVGNHEYVFSAFVNGKKEDAEAWVLMQGRFFSRKFPFCPMCGTKIDSEYISQESVEK